MPELVGHFFIDTVSVFLYIWDNRKEDMLNLSSRQTQSFNEEQIGFNKSVVETFDRTRQTLENLVNSINNLQTQVETLKTEIKELKEVK